MLFWCALFWCTLFSCGLFWCALFYMCLVFMYVVLKCLVFTWLVLPCLMLTVLHALQLLAGDNRIHPRVPSWDVRTHKSHQRETRKQRVCESLFCHFFRFFIQIFLSCCFLKDTACRWQMIGGNYLVELDWVPV